MPVIKSGLTEWRHSFVPRKTWRLWNNISLPNEITRELVDGSRWDLLRNSYRRAYGCVSDRTSLYNQRLPARNVALFSSWLWSRQWLLSCKWHALCRAAPLVYELFKFRALTSSLFCRFLPNHFFLYVGIARRWNFEFVEQTQRVAELFARRLPTVIFEKNWSEKGLTKVKQVSKLWQSMFFF